MVHDPRPNKTKISNGYREASVNRSESVLIIKSVVTQRAAVRCIVWLGDVTVLVLAV